MLNVRLVSLVLVALAAGLSRPVTAQPLNETELEARDAEAKQACSAGKVQEGARLLTELLRRTNDGTYIFNLGRCYQQNGQGDKALSQFRAYLVRPDVDPAAAARARAYIAELERPRSAPATAPIAAAPPVVPTPATITTTSPAPAGSDLVAPAPPPALSPTSPSPGQNLRIAGLVTGGIGLAGLATAAYYAQKTHALERDKRQAMNLKNQPDAWFADQDEKGEHAERRQWQFLGVGAAAAAAGGVLYYLGVRAGEEGSLQSARALPLALPGAVGAVIAGQF